MRARVRTWLRDVFRRSRVDAAFDAELQSCVEILTDEKVRQGVPPPEAHRQALLEAGGVGAITERVRDRRGGSWIRDGLRDARHGWRWLRRSPATAAIAILSLGLGIGFNVAAFTVLDAVLLRPLPVANPDRLVDLYTSGADGDPYSSSSLPDITDFAAGVPVLDGVIGYSPMVAPVSGDGRTDLVLGEVVTGNYFDVMGVRAELGRVLRPEDDAAGSARAAVISRRYWNRAFGGRPDVVGQVVRLGGQPYQVVGVLPQAFSGMLPMLAPEIWIPMRHQADIEPAGISEMVPSPTGTSRLDRRGQRWLFVKARLRPTVSIEEARAAVESVASRLRTDHPQTNRDRRVTLLPTRHTRVHPEADVLFTMLLTGTMIAVGLLLVVTCANVAGVLLARALSRGREIAIRLALGASRGRIVRQLLAESMVLGALGSTVGVVLAWWFTRAFATIELPIPVPLSLDLRLDSRVLAFTVLVTAVTGVLAGLVPASVASRTTVGVALKEAGVLPGASRRRWHVRDLIAVGQVAGTTLLLVVAALLVRSVVSAHAMDVGFRTEGLAVISADPTMIGYDAAETRVLWDRAEEQFRSIPGVEQVAFGSRFPFSLNFSRTNIAVPGHERDAEQMGVSIISATVSPHFFETLGVPILQGRDFAGVDAPDHATVILINETMAQRYWPDESAIGRTVYERTLSSGRPFRIVGVVADHKLQTVAEASQPAVYFSTTQRPNSFSAVMARTSGDEVVLLRAMEQVLLTLDPQLPIIERQTMREQISATLLPIRIAASALFVVGGVALLLAAIGLYGVLSAVVTRRTREIGVRIAMGATPRSVLSLVTRRGIGITTIGVVLGAVPGAAVAHAMADVLYGVRPIDPMAWMLALGLVCAVAGAASAIPAWRATRVDPVRALRAE